MDHHCLFLNRCVARNTHRLFLLFILAAMVAMVMFEYAAVMAVWEWYPGQSVSSIAVDMYISRPYLTTVMLANAVAWIWGANLVKTQLQVISRGHTMVWQPNMAKSSLSKSHRLWNIVYFFVDRRRYRWDPVLTVAITGSVL